MSAIHRPAGPALAAIHADLAAGKTILIDGATGTELERRGARMDDKSWCSMATLTHPDILRAVHEDYIKAGARLITANTFSTNRIMLEPAGHGAKVAEVNRRAVELALEARQRTRSQDRVVVAGSMSHQVPFGDLEGGGRRRYPPTPEYAAECFAEMAQLLAGAGVELMLMEMMSDPDLANSAIEAAAATGLPIWVGFSVQKASAGEVVSQSKPELGADAMFEAVSLEGVEVAGIMHTSADTTTEALELMKRHWQGPTMVYPDSGYFVMPHWQFVDIMPPDEFAQRHRDWIAAGVQVVGGCCGLGLEHIEALSDSLSAG